VELLEQADRFFKPVRELVLLGEGKDAPARLNGTIALIRGVIATWIETST
jgi:hypothetical protein